MVKGLKDNPSDTTKKLLLCDLENSPNIAQVLSVSKDNHMLATFVKGSDLDVDLTDGVDMLFIDSFHVYGQLKRELATHAHKVKKYILLHDTTVDSVHGEVIRKKMNANTISQQTGIPIDELTKGLKPAIQEFIRDGDALGGKWKIEKEYTNNNGLTILSRVAQ
jgi:hypothetical protein